MEAVPARSTVYESASVDSVTIPFDVLQELEKLEEVGAVKPWRPWMDDVLCKYWRTRRQDDVAEIIGIGVKRCRKRARELGI